MKDHLEEVLAKEEIVLLLNKQKALSGSPKPSISAAVIDNKPNTFLNSTLIKGLSDAKRDVGRIGNIILSKANDKSIMTI